MDIETQITNALNSNILGITYKLLENNSILVEEIEKESILFPYGLKKDDIIYKIDNLEMTNCSPKQIKKILAETDIDSSLIIYIKRGNDKLQLNLNSPIEERSFKESPKLGTRELLSNYELMDTLEEHATYKRQIHWMASKYFEKMNRLFVIPSIVITSISGILSFLASSDQVNLQIGGYLGLTVGCLASISSLLQSFSGAYGFGVKAEAHENAAEDYDQIITKVRFHKINAEEDEKIFIKYVEEQIGDIKTRCRYIVPDWIGDEYEKRNYERLRNRMIYKAKNESLESKINAYKHRINYYNGLLSDEEMQPSPETEKQYKELLNNVKTKDLERELQV